MKRAVMLVGVLLASGALLWLAWPAEEPVPTRPRTVVRLPAPATPGIPQQAPPDLETPDRPVGTELAQREAAVRDACGLGAELVCAGSDCVAMAEMPDLDGPLGWLALVRDAPSFVGSTVLRDVGVHPDRLPCGSAIEALIGHAGALTVARADGSEVWCVQGTGDAWEPRSRAVCDEASRELGLGVTGFTDPATRILSFDR